MLSTLHISNYALIDCIDVDFSQGLTIITGETGAGKSIILGALSLIMGERADSKFIGNSDKKTVVEVTFDLTGYGLKPLFEQNDIEYIEKECIIRREISSGGRSRSFINDTPVNLTVMRDIATRLVDIHSQHSNMLLSKPQFQLSILDDMAQNSKLLSKYHDLYETFKCKNEETKRLTIAINKAKEEEDYIRFQFDQLHALMLEENEDEYLEAKRNALSNAGEIKEGLWQVENILDGDDTSVMSTMSTVVQIMSNTEELYAEVEGLSERLHSIIIDLKDIVYTASAARENIVDDPDELKRVDERLNAIYSLERKHNVDSVNALLEIEETYRNSLSKIDNSDMLLEQLKKEREQAYNAAVAVASEIKARRKSAAVKFAKHLKAEAIKLGLKNIEFMVEFTDCELNHSGSDVVEYKVAFNKKQTPTAVRYTASGGEMSRLMLCVKSIVAQSTHLPTIIFDEVDTGVSGEIATMLGEMMHNISRHIQVFTITHLPQVAAYSDHHMRVFKTDTPESTVTSIETLDHDSHIREVARLLSGRDINNAALENAKTLIDNSNFNDK